MGNFFSSPTPPPPPPPPRQPLTMEPWRKPSVWSEHLEEALRSEIIELEPEETPNLITIGPVGAGKSSYINSILSIAIGRKCILAPSGEYSSSYTVDFKTFDKGCLLAKYRLMDCMGIEPTDGHGVQPDDIAALLEGHISSGYSFNPAKPISKSDPKWRSNPQIKHQIHCVIFVVDSSTLHADIPRAYVQKIKQLQEKIKRANVPRILVLTKVDRLCGEVKRDIRKIFQSVKVRDAVKIASELFGIDQASIHPVKNYEVDFELDPNSNIPLLFSVRQAMHYALDRVEGVLHSDDF